MVHACGTALNGATLAQRHKRHPHDKNTGFARLPARQQTDFWRFFLELGASAPSQVETHPSQKLFMPIFVLYG